MDRQEYEFRKGLAEYGAGNIAIHGETRAIRWLEQSFGTNSGMVIRSDNDTAPAPGAITKPSLK